MPRILFPHTYEDIISVENLLGAWQEFLKGKRKKPDVQEFGRHLMKNIFSLHHDLKDGTYRHGGYTHFRIADPKPRNIHKATVRDRLLHHALYRKLYPFFDRTFIADSYSCRKGKGTHKAVNRFRAFAFRVSKNHTRTCWVLKCDIRKFFASIDHGVLKHILGRYIPDTRLNSLLSDVIDSFPKGLPLGNLTSQLFVNVYMNEFDQFVKHVLKVKYYIRYADDFVLLSEDRRYLEERFSYMRIFLSEHLALELHPDKVSIQTLASGVDFLGWVHFSHHRVVRSRVKHRALKALNNPQALASYVGLLKHGNAIKVQSMLCEKHRACLKTRGTRAEIGHFRNET